MRKWSPIYGHIIVPILILLLSCERRPLEDGDNGTVIVPVSIDWSVSHIPVGEIHRASIWLFPKAGGEPLEFRLEGNVTYKEIAVPVGSYSVLIFNETTDSTDWNSIGFRGTDKFETFAAYARPEPQKGFYVRDKELLVKNPDMLAVWSSDIFVVTDAMVKSGRPGLTDIQPLPCVDVAIITVYVVNLKSVFQATGLLQGMSDGVLLASGKRLSTIGVYPFLLSNREYSSNNKDGTIKTVFNTFGEVPQSGAQYGVQLDFILTDGTGLPAMFFDVTGLIDRVIVDHLTTLNINLGMREQPVILPELDIDAGISVDDWEEVVTPLK